MYMCTHVCISVSSFRVFVVGRFLAHTEWEETSLSITLKACLCIHVFPAQGKRFGNNSNYLLSCTCIWAVKKETKKKNDKNTIHKTRSYSHVHLHTLVLVITHRNTPTCTGTHLLDCNHSDGFNRVFKPEKWAIIKVFVLYFVSYLRQFIGVVFGVVL